MAHHESSGIGERQEAQEVEGRYANHLSVGHNAFEFVLDFGQFYRDALRARVHTRIIVSPSYVKAFVETLRESIDQYEDTFGPLADECSPFQPPPRGTGDDPSQ